MFDVCVVGGCGIDHVFISRSDGSFPDVPDSIVPAGKGSNQAVAASRAGASVCILSCVGDDDNGHMAIENLRSEGIDTSNVSILSGIRTDCNIVRIDTDGDNHIIRETGATDSITPEYIDSVSDILRSASIVMVHTKVPEVTVDRVLDICHSSRIPVMVTPCPPERLDIMSTEGRARLSKISYITANREESLIITNSEDHFEAILLANRKLIATLGGDGVMFFDEDIVTLNVPHVERVVDTTGAGDTFAGNLAYRIVKGVPLRQAVNESMHAASYKTQFRTAQAGMPYPDQLKEFMSGKGGSIE